MNQEYLSVNNISFEYPDGFKALENINLSFRKVKGLQYWDLMELVKPLSFFI